MPQAAVVVLTADTSDEALLESIEAGVAGYLVKSADAASIATTVRRAAAGEMLIVPSVLSGLLSRSRRKVRPAPVDHAEHLTPREREVLELVIALSRLW